MPDTEDCIIRGRSGSFGLPDSEVCTICGKSEKFLVQNVLGILRLVVILNPSEYCTIMVNLSV